MTYVPIPQPHRILIVCHDLKGPAASYAKFFEILKAQGVWWHYLPSTWLLHSQFTPDQVSNALRPHLLGGDHIFVGTLQNGYSGWLPKDAWEWISARGVYP